ncbi:PAS domain-containing protein [Vreelandella rituensis]|uniref:PAS domain-containing protein n=1 Tax=Vreelandella rituensis TaxID=2282306 RepID=A0A368TVE4_9GAMM|nr:PAS domain-containing protein [Halomonas rituensis]RCV88735.1 PAS domain-containing protein [Halomonas rituensis]
MSIENVRAKLLKIAVEQSYNSVLVTNSDISPGGPFIVYCNKAFCLMTGYSSKELLGKSPRILQGPDTDSAVIDTMRDALNKKIFWEGSTVNYRKSGEIYIVNWNISPVFGNGVEVTHFVSVQQEVTQFHIAKEENNALAKLLNKSPDPALVVNSKWRIVFSNTAFESLSGYQSNELMGEIPTCFIPGEQDCEVYQKMLKTFDAGQPFQAHLVNKSKDGERKFIHHTIEPIIDNSGKNTHFIVILDEMRGD